MRLNEANRKIAEYENTLAKLNNEIQRLNMVLRGKVDEISEYDANLKKANTEIQEYRRRLHDLEEANQMIAKY